MNRRLFVSLFDVMFFIILNAAYCHMIYLSIKQLPLPPFYASPAWMVLTRAFWVAVRTHNDLEDRS